MREIVLRSQDEFLVVSKRCSWFVVLVFGSSPNIRWVCRSRDENSRRLENVELDYPSDLLLFVDANSRSPTNDYNRELGWIRTEYYSDFVLLSLTLPAVAECRWNAACRSRPIATRTLSSVWFCLSNRKSRRKFLPFLKYKYLILRVLKCLRHPPESY